MMWKRNKGLGEWGGGAHRHVQTLSYFVRQQVGALSKYGSGVTVGTKLTLI